MHPSDLEDAPAPGASPADRPQPPDEAPPPDDDVAPAPTPTPLAARPLALVALAAAAIGLALRLRLVSSPYGVVDSDEAITGLIARHLPEEWSPFLWDNAYGGSLEALPTTVAVQLFGSSTLALKSVPIALTALACVLTWRAGQRLGGRVAGVVAGSLLWIYPLAYVLSSTKARLYYSSGLAITAAVLLVCLRLADRRRMAEVGLLGLLVGLALWAHPLVLLAQLPVVTWLVFRRPSVLVGVPLALPAALLGALPWLMWNLDHEWGSLEQPGPPVATTYLQRLEGYATDLFPATLGLRLTFDGGWFLGVVGIVAYLAALGGLAWLALRRRAELAPVLVVLAAFPFLFAIPAGSYYTAEPRYGLFLMPASAVLVGWVVARLPRPSMAVPGVLALAALLTVASIAYLDRFARSNDGVYDLDPPRVEPLVAFLDERRLQYVWADYWIAYRLTNELDERIVATPVEYVRYLAYDRLAVDGGARTYVLYLDSRRDRRMTNWLRNRSVGYQRDEVADFVVYTLDEQHTPNEFPTVWFG